jgi:hypothetical protein
MTLRRLLIAPLAAAVLAAASPASAYIAINGLVVQDDGQGNMFVAYQGLSGDPAFWCAVGDYVLNFRDMPSGTRIYRTSEPPRRQGQGISFSLSPENAASRTGLAVMTDGPKGSISTTTAFALCPVRYPFGFRSGLGFFF